MCLKQETINKERKRKEGEREKKENTTFVTRYSNCFFHFFSFFPSPSSLSLSQSYTLFFVLVSLFLTSILYSPLSLSLLSSLSFASVFAGHHCLLHLSIVNSPICSFFIVNSFFYLRRTRRRRRR